jgi:hypothetical protein
MLQARGFLFFDLFLKSLIRSHGGIKMPRSCDRGIQHMLYLELNLSFRRLRKHPDCRVSRPSATGLHLC